MEYKHFSHDHHLNLYQSQPGQNLLCHGCESPISDSSSIYACWTCKFFLHDHCGNANRFIKHPSHPAHPLILLPTYCSGSFICNACGSVGNSFSYCCPLCEIDLHLNCAFLPPKINHNSHQHDLVIVPNLAKKNGMAYVCKLCDKRIGDKNWNYCCVGCDFRLHTFCATDEVKPGLYVDDEDPEDVKREDDDDDDEQVIELTEEEMIQLYKIQILTQMMSNANV